MENDTTENLSIYSYVNYFFTVLLFVVIGVIIYLEFKPDPRPDHVENVTIPQINFITNEEFQAELETFAYDNYAPKTIIDLDSSAVLESKTVTAEESNQIIAKEAYISQNYSNSQSDYVPSKNQTESLNVSVPEGVDVKVTMRTDDYKGEEKIVMSFEGVIYSLDDTRIVLSKSDNSGFGIINVSNHTKIQINGKLVDITSLKTGHKIAVEGLGYPETNEIDAKVILLFGTFNLTSN